MQNRISSFYFLFIILFFFVYQKINYFIINTKFKLLTALYSCDRSFLLNRTIYNFYVHVLKFENNLDINFYFIDSGTQNRLFYYKKYNIKNLFFMNPNDPEYSYGMFWSYLHNEFVLFLEDDRPFIENIEHKIIQDIKEDIGEEKIEKEIEELEDKLIKVGIPQFVLLRGNPGIGKTSLLFI